MRSDRPAWIAVLLLACASCTAGEAAAQDRDPAPPASLPAGVDEAAARLPASSRQSLALADGEVSQAELRDGLGATARCAESAASERGVVLAAAITDGPDRPTMSYEIAGFGELDHETQSGMDDDLNRCELLHSGLLEMVLDDASALGDGANVVVDEMVRLGISG